MTTLVNFQVAIGRVERVHAAARVGGVHHAVDDDGRRLIADAVDDAVLKQPARRERLDVAGVDLIERREAGAREVEVVQRPVDVLRRSLRRRSLRIRLRKRNDRSELQERDQADGERKQFWAHSAPSLRRSEVGPTFKGRPT